MALPVASCSAPLAHTHAESFRDSVCYPCAEDSRILQNCAATSHVGGVVPSVPFSMSETRRQCHRHALEFSSHALCSCRPGLV